MTATTTTARMSVPMRETPCDHCGEEAITREFGWKDETARMWVGFCSQECADGFFDAPLPVGCTKAV